MTNDGSGADESAAADPSADEPTDSASGPRRSDAGGPGGGRHSSARWFHRPVVLSAVALVLAASGVSTIAYAVTRPDANHPPSVVGADNVSGGVPVPVLPAASVAPSDHATTVPSVATTVPPPLPAATVVPLYPSPTATGSRRASPSHTRPVTPSPSRTAGPSTSPSQSPTSSPSSLPNPLGSADPVQVVVRKLGIDRKPIRLGLTKDNALEVPGDAEDLGWYTGGPTPGAMGASVIAGHVSYNRPGVFYRLATLQRGDTIEVRRKDGTTAVFTVSGTRVYPKDKFPTDDVYGFVDRAALRLITCGGTYDPQTRHFEDNVVVYADMTSVRS